MPRLTEPLLLQILPRAGGQAGIFAPVLNVAMGRYGIITRLRIAAFIAQIGHESGQLRYVRELGSNKYLEKYDAGRLAAKLGNTPEIDGDGQKFRGRGLIQITGTFNYHSCSQALFGDDRLLIAPELLEQPKHASMSAAWYWQIHGLNGLADRGDFRQITMKINGGTNGWEDREKLYERALEVLQ